jgi:polysaccharide deacetylase 2 family uncharacterized protein YibQ
LVGLLCLLVFASGWFFLAQIYGNGILEETEDFILSRENGRLIVDYGPKAQRIEDQVLMVLQSANVLPTGAGPESIAAWEQEMELEVDEGLLQWPYRSCRLVGDSLPEDLLSQLALALEGVGGEVVASPGQEDELLLTIGFPTEDQFIITHELLLERRLPARPRPLARVAVVIDDWGYDWGAAESLLELPGPLTLAVLPHVPYSQRHASLGLARGHEILLHLPMEALSGLDAGPGMVTVDMDDEEIARLVREAIASVPGIVGVSNHMGSKVTSDSRAMGIILEVVREHGLFFFDSNTAPASVVPALSRSMGVPFAVNYIFLDNVAEEASVRRQFERLIRRALREGSAIGIGHVKKATAKVLHDMLPTLPEQGIELVPLSELLEYPQPWRAAAPE